MIIARGAEAVIEKKKDSVIKKRVAKSYRHPAIDEALRKKRTRQEARLLKACPVKCPRLIRAGKTDIEMSYVQGQKLADILESTDYITLCSKLGKNIRKMHGKGIIHGDLTTGNLILSDDLVLIDFGLSFHSEKAEDKAVDLHLLGQAFQSRHHTIAGECFKAVLNAYSDSAVLSRLKQVQARGRNKQKSHQATNNL